MVVKKKDRQREASTKEEEEEIGASRLEGGRGRKRRK